MMVTVVMVQDWGLHGGGARLDLNMQYRRNSRRVDRKSL